MNAKRNLVLLPLLLTAAVCLFDVSCVVGVHGRGGGGLWVDVAPPALREEVVIGGAQLRMGARPLGARAAPRRPVGGAALGARTARLAPGRRLLAVTGPAR